MLLALFLGVGVCALALSTAGGFRTGVRFIYIPVLLLAPVWLGETGISSVVLDLRMAAACGILPVLALVVLRERQRLLLADILVGALIATIFFSMRLAGEVRLLTFFEILRWWLLPYLMGRWCFASREDVDRFLPLMMPICLLIAAWAVFEAVTHVNPVLKLPMAPYFPALEGVEGYRWGLKRAQGPLEHPIYWGMAIVMVLPWAMAAAHRAWTKRGPSWRLLPPGLLVVAIVATVSLLGSIVVTVSRGAMLAAIITVFLGIILRWPRLRIPVLVVSLAAGSLLWAGKDVMIPKLTKLISTEDEAEEPTMYISDYKPEAYMVDRHRQLLKKVYKPFLDNTGWFGHGSDIRTSVTAKISDEALRARFASIDNHYLLFYLQHGRLGLGLFWALQICVLVYLLRASWNVSTPESILAGSMFGAMVGMALALWGVWFAQDYAAVWLFCAGMAGCLRSLPKGEGPASPPASSSTDDSVGDHRERTGTVAQWVRRAFRKRWWLCALILVASGIGSWLLVRQYVPLTYKATGAIMHRGLVMDPQISDIAPPPLETRTAVNLMVSQESLRTIRDEFAPGVPVKVLANFFEVEDDGTLVIRVSMWWDDPEQAAKMVNRLMELFNEKNNQRRQGEFKQIIERDNYDQRVEDRARAETEARKRLQAFLDQYKVADLTAGVTRLQISLTRIQTLLQSTLQEKSTVTLLGRGNEARIQEAIKTEEARLVALQARLEPNIKSREANLVVLQKQVDRYKNGPYPKARLQQAEAELKAAQVQLEGLRSQLADTVAKLKRLRDPATAEIAALVPLQTERESLKTRFADAEARVATLNKEAEDVQKRSELLQSVLPEEAKLKRAVETARAEHERLATRRRLLEELANSDANEYTVTEVATPPVRPSGRERRKAWVRIMAGAMLLCCFLVLALEVRSFPRTSREPVPRN